MSTPAEIMGLAYQRALALWAAYARLWGYSAELDAVVEGCSRLP